MKKFSTVEQAIDDKTAHPHYMLDTYGYKHTLRLCNNYCFSTASMVTRKRLNVTLYVQSLYCCW